MEKKPKSDRIQEGQLLVRTIIEMLGAPKEHIEKTMKDYVEKLKEDHDLEIVSVFYSKPEPQKEKLFSLYAELEVWMKDVEKLMAFCFDSLPSSIEILEPGEFKFKSNKFSGMINDLQAKIHKLDAHLKRFITDQQAGAQKFKQVVNNFIVFCIKAGKSSPDEIAKELGIDKARAVKWLDDMAEKKIIHKKNNTYSI